MKEKAYQVPAHEHKEPIYKTGYKTRPEGSVNHWLIWKDGFCYWFHTIVYCIKIIISPRFLQVVKNIKHLIMKCFTMPEYRRFYVKELLPHFILQLFHHIQMRT